MAISDEISFYGHWYCGICDQAWSFAPQENGTEMTMLDHDCDEEELDYDDLGE